MLVNYNTLKHCTLILFLCITTIVFSQSFDFKNYTVNDGLLQSTVNDIKQDKNGFIWIATEGGLSRFDGQTFKNYSTQNGLPETAITSMLFDNDGALWLGTATGKLFVFENNTFKQFKLKEDSLCKRIMNLFIDSRKNLWVATEGLGAIKITSTKKNKVKAEYKSYHDDAKLGTEINQVFEDEEGIIWFTSQNGIRRYNYATGSIEIFAPSSMPRYYYTSISKGTNGKIIFGTNGSGVCEFTPKTSNVFFYDDSNGLTTGIVPFATMVKDSSIWVSTWDASLTQIKNKKITTYTDKNGLVSNKVRCMYQDLEGNLWFGTQDNGVMVFKGNKFNHYTKRNGLTDNVVNAIKKVGSKIFVGTNYGISILNNNTIQAMSVAQQVGSDLITDFAIGNNNQLYVSTFRGSILVLNSQTLMPIGSIQLKDDLVNALYFDKNNVLWVATNRGVSFFKNNSNLINAPVKAAQLDDIEAVSFFNDSKQNLWIGTRRHGLIKITNNNITYFTSSDGLNHKSPTTICEDNKGTLWIGTEGGGLYSYANGKFTNFTVKDGLISDFITTINHINNNIWLGTNKGICKLNPQTNTFSNYNQYDGFRELEVKPNASLVINQKIYYGTINGLVAVNLDELIPNKIAPKINLTKLEIFGKEYQYPKNLVLNYRDKDITFHFNAISFTAPEKVTYKYRLLGLEDSWHTSTNSSYTSYTNIEYGNYTFQIKAMNGDGVWSNTTNYEFSIDAPFWMKKWFWLLVIFATIAAIIWYGRQRRKKLLLDKQLLEQQVIERTKEIQEKNGELVMMNVDISLKNKEITDSINYAKRLQDSILPSNDALKSSLQNIFVLYKPKSIVSGDFYWYAQTQNIDNQKEFLLAAADCTGHGVPGAFMCMVATSLLNQIVVDNKIYTPSEVLQNLNNGVRSVLKQQETETRDGMDIALCKINTHTNVIEFAGALRPLYIFRDFRTSEQKLTDFYFEEIKPDKYPIGGLQYETIRTFENKSIKLNKGDTFYMFSDGFADQFGGKEGKKLMTKKFKEILHVIQPLTMEEQKIYLENFFTEWVGTEEQIDDVMVLGIRI